MKSRIPFTDYDFYAYLVTGLSLLLVLDLAFNDGFLSSGNARWTHFLIAGVLAYILGQLLASASQATLEAGLAHRVLGHPAEVLLGTEQRRLGLANALGGRFYKPLSPAFLQIVRDVIGEAREVDNLTARDKYEIAYAWVRLNADTVSRLEASRNQYTFARNVALASFLDMVLFAYMSGRGIPWALSAAICALLIALGMTHRFLKFYSTFYAQIFRALAANLKGAPGSA